MQEQNRTLSKIQINGHNDKQIQNLLEEVSIPKSSSLISLLTFSIGHESKSSFRKRIRGEKAIVGQSEECYCSTHKRK
jgi:hypothetical protein